MSEDIKPDQDPHRYVKRTHPKIDYTRSQAVVVGYKDITPQVNRDPGLIGSYVVIEGAVNPFPSAYEKADQRISVYSVYDMTVRVEPDPEDPTRHPVLTYSKDLVIKYGEGVKAEYALFNGEQELYARRAKIEEEHKVFMAEFGARLTDSPAGNDHETA